MSRQSLTTSALLIGLLISLPMALFSVSPLEIHSPNQNFTTATLEVGESEWSENFTTRQSAFWISVDCPSESDCEELSLSVVDSQGNEFITEGRFHVELLGNVSYGNTHVSITRLGNTSQNLKIQHIFFDTFSGEFGDAPPQLPAPGENDSAWPVADITGCLNFVWCGFIDRTEMDPNATWLNGTLNSPDDSDTFKINSSRYDLIELQVEAISDDITLELWNLTESDMVLLEQHQYMASSGFTPTRIIIEETIGDTWISISGHGSEFSLYSIRMANHSQYYEVNGPEIGYDLPINPWYSGYENSTMTAHIVTGDPGDSLIYDVGSRGVITFDWYFSGPAELRIESRDGNWETLETHTNLTGSTTITAPEDSEMLSVVITNATAPMIWSITATNHGPWDAGWDGDAKDGIPINEADAYGMASFNSDFSGGFTGEIGGEDIRDVYWISRPYGQPYNTILTATIEGDPGCCYLKLIELNTTNYNSWTTVSWNQTEMNGQQATVTLDLPEGQHLIVVESNSNHTVPYEISWAWMDNGKNVSDVGEWVDYSGEMKGFYIIIGIVLLLPMMVAIYWKLTDGDDTEIQSHEKHRLMRLLQRVQEADPANEMDPNALLHALESLADTDWEALEIQWGKPLTRHTTASVDIAVWQISSTKEISTIAVGLNVGDEKWTLAGIRFQAIQGGEWNVESVTPEALVEKDEVFLGNLKANTRHFFRIDLTGNASGFDLMLSGLQNGEPMAAMPSQAALLEEE